MTLSGIEARDELGYQSQMKALIVALFTIGVSGLAHASDPLLDRMQGTWEGEGTRTQLYSHTRTRIHSQSVATLQDGRLYSHNEITETSLNSEGTPDAPARHYIRDYWIRAATSESEHPPLLWYYELGVGTGASEKVNSQGMFDGTFLEVAQEMGGSPALTVHSKTEFQTDASLYTEAVKYGQDILSEAQIRYIRR